MEPVRYVGHSDVTKESKKVWFEQPPRAVCRLTPEEVWACQGRSMNHWSHLVEEGVEPSTILVEGARATGGQTGTLAGAAWDSVDDANMMKLLRWLRQWKRGLFPRVTEGPMARRAGGYADVNSGSDEPCDELPAAPGLPPLPDRLDFPLPGGSPPEHDSELRAGQVWHRAEALWLSDSSDDECVAHNERRAGRAPETKKRQSERAIIAQGGAQVADWVEQVDEWVDENLCGYLAVSTTKQYAGVYGKWKAGARRQGWATEFLDKSMATEENENKLLGFLGYLGWLGASPATLKQAGGVCDQGRTQATWPCSWAPLTNGHKRSHEGWA